VREGKLSARQLAMLKRWEGAHANAIEGFAPFVGGVVSFLPVFVLFKCGCRFWHSKG
jgi:hypothetical protein